MSRTTYQISSPGFIVDDNSIVRGTGRQIDWANVATDGTFGATGSRVIPAGTAMGTLLGAGKGSPRVAATNPATFLLATDAPEDSTVAALSGFGDLVGGAVYENLLPDATGGPPRALPAAVKTELSAAGTGFAFFTYSDVR